jgi:transposase
METRQRILQLSYISLTILQLSYIPLFMNTMTYLKWWPLTGNILCLVSKRLLPHAKRKPVLDRSLQERLTLEAQALEYTSRYCDVIRAKIVLLAAEGFSNDVIAARLDTPRQIVSKWPKRFALAQLSGLESQPRGGRPTLFSSSVVVHVKALACELPHRLQLRLSRLSLSEIRRELPYSLPRFCVGLGTSRG